ncbi:hypothetical protein JHK87_009500 [Glycine soja]|nr:hypothetical protein JHK87_009500 [Glycine soja]
MHRLLGSSFLTRVAQVLVVAFRKKNASFGSSGFIGLYEVPGRQPPIKGSRKITHVDEFLRKKGYVFTRGGCSYAFSQFREQSLTDPRLPRNKFATIEFIPCSIEIRFYEPQISTNQTKSHLRLRYLFRARGKLSDGQAFHRCVVAYTSDLIFLQVSLNPNCRKCRNAHVHVVSQTFKN